MFKWTGVSSERNFITAVVVLRQWVCWASTVNQEWALVEIVNERDSMYGIIMSKYVHHEVWVGCGWKIAYLPILLSSQLILQYKCLYIFGDNDLVSLWSSTDWYFHALRQRYAHMKKQGNGVPFLSVKALWVLSLAQRGIGEGGHISQISGVSRETWALKFICTTGRDPKHHNRFAIL